MDFNEILYAHEKKGLREIGVMVKCTHFVKLWRWQGLWIWGIRVRVVHGIMGGWMRQLCGNGWTDVW